MAIQRHNGTAWAGEAKATFTRFDGKMAAGAHPIWLRARSVWYPQNGQWQPTSAGTAAGADVATLAAQTRARSSAGGAVVANPTLGDTSLYWESLVQVTAGPTCYSYALWMCDTVGAAALWKFHGAYLVAPNATQSHTTQNLAHGVTPVRWCATAWSGQAIAANGLPDGQQGFSRFAPLP